MGRLILNPFCLFCALFLIEEIQADPSSSSRPSKVSFLQFHGWSLAMGIVCLVVVGVAVARGICLCRKDCSKASEYTNVEIEI
jgi:hypothetical protein